MIRTIILVGLVILSIPSLTGSNLAAESTETKRSSDSCCGHNMKGMKGGNRMCPMGGQMPAISFPESELPNPRSKGAQLFKNYCAQCHSLPSPKSHSPEHWDLTFERMFRRMRMMEREKQSPWGRWMPDVQAPSINEAKVLLAYLKQNALKPAPEDLIPDEDDPGANLFAKTCARCHTLPDPSQHTAEEWTIVVKRMRSNMKQMGVPDIEEDVQKQIIEYLARVTSISGR